MINTSIEEIYWINDDVVERYYQILIHISEFLELQYTTAEKQRIELDSDLIDNPRITMRDPEICGPHIYPVLVLNTTKPESLLRYWTRIIDIHDEVNRKYHGYERE